MPKDVDLNIDNATKCVCPVCPVQAKSECIAAKRPRWERRRVAVGDILTEYPDHPEAFEMDYRKLEATEVGKGHGFEMPDTSDMMELYCSKTIGRSDCDDLDDTKPCQCPTCTVWASHQLDSTYYCLGVVGAREDSDEGDV
jgi:hypothetical protein